MVTISVQDPADADLDLDLDASTARAPPAPVTKMGEAEALRGAGARGMRDRSLASMGGQEVS